MPLAKTAMQGVGVICDMLNTDLTDWADAMRVGGIEQKQNKNTLWVNSHSSSL